MLTPITDEFIAIVDEAIRQRNLLKLGHVKSTADWWLYDRAMRDLMALYES